MSFLIVAGSTIPVAAGSVSVQTVEVGDRHRSFAGGVNSSVTAVFRTWRFQTVARKTTDAATLYSLFSASSQPLACSGDMLNSTGMNCDTRVEGWRSVVGSTGGQMVSLDVVLEETT